MEATSSKSKVLTEEWKIFFFVFLLSVDNIVGLFSKVNIKSYTKVSTLNPTLNSLLRKFTSNLLRIHFEFKFEFTLMGSVLQNHFIGNKASEINKNLFWYFYWNYVYFFTSVVYWKFYTRKLLFQKKQ